ncbi:hypothetical protein VNO77_21816 [Canavalia gladiata]|uniref:Phytocyanin domain-containing protein n=1 Tax=Canavalia gladiata TaxID=3824 RepID=A0AAN9L412_CANGL
MGLNLIGCSIVAMVFLIGAIEAITEYKVGDSFGWNVPTNENFYSEWVSTKKFFVGDKLIFNWSGEHTVGIASAAEYNNCNNDTSSFGSNLNDTSFQVALTRPGPYYFICTIDNHCERGQKFSIKVESPNSDAPTYPQPGSASPTLSFRISSAFLFSLAMYLALPTS